MATPPPPPTTPIARLLGETRGQLLSLLRSQPRTVNDLAETLQLTDNAVRAHLADLQNQDLVRQAGERPGTRKPHTLYELTPRAHELLSRLYAPVLNTLLGLLQERLSPQQLGSLVRAIGHRLAEPHREAFARKTPPARLDAAVELLGELGGVARVRRDDDATVIEGQGCPLATAVSAHPEVCALVETLLSDLLGTPVHEHCDKSAPRCCFKVGHG